MRTLIRENNWTGTLTIEADSPEEAMQELHSRLGPGAAVESATRVTRGGIAGFFAKERFEVRARLPEAWGSNSEGGPLGLADQLVDTLYEADLAAAPGANEAVPAAPAPAGPGGGTAPPPAPQAGPPRTVTREPVSLPVETLVGGPNGADFATALQTALFGAPEKTAGIDPVPVAFPQYQPAATEPEMPTESESDLAAAAAAVGAPIWRLAGPALPRPAGLGRVRWGKQALLDLGLPPAIASAGAGLDTRDDLGWLNAIANAVAPLCRPLPAGDVMLVGSGSERLGGLLGLPNLEPPDLRLYEGSLSTTVADTPRDLEWLARMKGSRTLHLMLGDSPWLHLLVDDPAAVSYGTDAAVVDALYVALTLGCPLGYGTDGGGELHRVGPIDVALAVRRMVGRQ